MLYHKEPTPAELAAGNVWRVNLLNPGQTFLPAMDLPTLMCFPLGNYQVCFNSLIDFVAILTYGLLDLLYSSFSIGEDGRGLHH